MLNTRPTALAAATLLAIASTAHAAIATRTASGSIRFGAPLPAPFDHINAGDAWSMTFTFDTEATDAFPGDPVDEYPLTGFTLTIGDASASNTPIDLGAMSLSRHPSGNVLYIGGTLPAPNGSSLVAAIIFSDADAIAFPSDDETPWTGLDLTPFEFAGLEFIYFPPAPDPSQTVVGDTHSYIPTPGALTLAGIATLILITRRR